MPPENNHGYRRLLQSDQSAAVLRHSYPRTVDLAAVRLATELGHELEHLGEAGRTDWMAARLQTTRGVDRDVAADRRPSPLSAVP